MYLLDTDTLVWLLRGEPAVTQGMGERAAAPKAFSVITYGELLYGAMRSARPVESAAKVRRLAEIFPVIAVSGAVMETFATLRVKLEQTGMRLDDFDLVIASTAIHLGYTLVTGNTRHFSRVPDLTIENWMR